MGRPRRRSFATLFFALCVAFVVSGLPAFAAQILAESDCAGACDDCDHEKQRPGDCACAGCAKVVPAVPVVPAAPVVHAAPEGPRRAAALPERTVPRGTCREIYHPPRA